MDNIATKELLKTLPKYKHHGIIRASKIKKINLIGTFTLWGDITVTEPKGVTVRVDAMFLQKYRPEIGGYLLVDQDGVSLDIENYCTLSSFFIISGFFGNVIFWMLRRSCGDIEHR
ncbi:hypothetical protein [Escherichia coli]|uniref:hypothetical protein n=1 Tax=Escherichia coli TaxID=562 RepID=UPI00227FD475|nr:hypothetical protein [Escherichia coli]MCZ0224706.1 hypothetical protein [Escherichia coli]MCZ0370674.1 hypothetical protein [Escherichia coli]